MRKTIKTMSFIALLVTIVFALSSFTKVTNMNSEKSCIVAIKYQNGDPVESITVTASYSGIVGGPNASTLMMPDNTLRRTF